MRQETSNYYINGGTNFVEKCINQNFIYNDHCIKIKVPIIVETKKATMFRNAEYSTSFGFIGVPLLMFRKENKFYEYFSKAYIGDVWTSPYSSSFIPKDIDIRNPVIDVSTQHDTWDHTYYDIKQCPYSEFLQCVTDLTLALKKHGIDEVRLKEKILQCINETNQSRQTKQQSSRSECNNTLRTATTENEPRINISFKDELATMTDSHARIAAEQAAELRRQQLEAEHELSIVKEIQQQYISETVVKLHTSLVNLIKDTTRNGDYIIIDGKKKITVEIPFKDYTFETIHKSGDGFVFHSTNETHYTQNICLTELGKHILNKLSLVVATDGISCELVCTAEFYRHFTGLHEDPSYKISKIVPLTQSNISIRAKKWGDEASSRNTVHIRATILF